MSNIPVETTEPDPAATSISNDQTVNKEAGDPSAPTNAETVMADAEPAKSNGAAEVKTEKADVDMEKNGEETPVKEENGDSPKAKREHHDRKDYDRRDNKYRKPYVKHNNHSKYDPSVLPESSDPKKMRAQVEYYFSDSNLPTDNNMWNKTDGTSNLPVSLKHIHKFKRMHRFQPYEAVVAALKESAFLDVVGEEGEEMVKRKVAYDPSYSRSDELKKRSVYAKGFGDEEPSSQFDIEAFFTTYGPTNRVTLRRDEDRLFKGSVFVEFHDEKTAQDFLKIDPKPLWKGKHELVIMSKGEYMATKKVAIDNGEMEPKESWGPNRGRGGHGHGRGRGRGSYNDRNGRGGRDYDRRDRGDRDPDDWKKRREEDRASGFKDPRGNRKDHGHKGGRGGRRDDRGFRNNDRNREREDEKEDKAVKNEDSPVKDVKTEESAPAVKKEETTPVKNDKKRAREDDDEMGGPAKKVDSKSEVPVEAS